MKPGSVAHGTFNGEAIEGVWIEGKTAVFNLPLQSGVVGAEGNPDSIVARHFAEAGKPKQKHAYMPLGETYSIADRVTSMLYHSITDTDDLRQMAKTYVLEVNDPTKDGFVVFLNGCDWTGDGTKYRPLEKPKIDLDKYDADPYGTRGFIKLPAGWNSKAEVTAIDESAIEQDRRTESLEERCRKANEADQAWIDARQKQGTAKAHPAPLNDLSADSSISDSVAWWNR